MDFQSAIKKTNRRIVTAVVFGALVAACRPVPKPMDHEIAEAAIRHMLRNASESWDYASAFCVGFGAGNQPNDPSPGFLARLNNVWPPVGPYSQCRVGPDSMATDRRTNKQAVMISLYDLACFSPTHCKLKIDYYRANLGAEGYTYDLEKRDGRWSVAKAVQDWIS